MKKDDLSGLIASISSNASQFYQQKLHWSPKQSTSILNQANAKLHDPIEVAEMAAFLKEISALTQQQLNKTNSADAKVLLKDFKSMVEKTYHNYFKMLQQIPKRYATVMLRPPMANNEHFVPLIQLCNRISLINPAAVKQFIEVFAKDLAHVCKPLSASERTSLQPQINQLEVLIQQDRKKFS